ncbi:MAG: substrate-binding domain-containing protein [Pseudomonadota bacterium]
MNLKELSETLGLSPTTVSRALNGYPEVSEITRRKVKAAAEVHGYRPNPRARGLATGRSLTIGHVIPISSKHEMVNPIFTDFIAGAGETYARAGYDMQLSIVSDEDEEDAYRNFAAKGKVDGVIVHAPRAPDPRIEFLTEIGLPFLVHGRATNDANYSWLDVNNKSAFQRATEFLLDLGHRRIALINGTETLNFAARRRAGYDAALAAKGIAADPALMSSEDMTETYGWRMATAMLDQPEPPTAFVVSSIIPAIGVRRAVQDRGAVLGRDVSVVAHDDEVSFLRNEGTPPMFTATRSSVREAGRRAAELLLELIEAPQETRQELWEAQLIVGASTGPAPS